MKKLCLITVLMLVVCSIYSVEKKPNEKCKHIKTVYKKKPPFCFRFPPELSSITGPVVISKAKERVKGLGICKVEMVKDVNSGEFFGWCSSNKIREYRTIYIIDPNNPMVPISEHKIEITFNKYASLLVKKLNEKEKKKHQKTQSERELDIARS